MQRSPQLGQGTTPRKPCRTMPHCQKEAKSLKKKKVKKTLAENDGEVKAENEKEKPEIITAEDLKVGDVLEVKLTAQPGERPVQFMATVRRIIEKKKKPFVLECSDGKVISLPAASAPALRCLPTLPRAPLAPWLAFRCGRRR